MECHTSQCIDILSNPIKKGLSLIIQNMNDSAICGFLKMPPPHKDRPALANATCHQAVCVRNFQCHNGIKPWDLSVQPQQCCTCAPAE